MFLPEGFDFLSGYKISGTDAVMGRISGFGISFLVYGQESSLFSHELVHQTVLPAGDEDEINVLSSQLGVDESIRKMLVEISPKGMYGIVIVNEHRGILSVIRSAMGGVSGGAGVIRTVEYVYKFPPDNIKDEKQLKILPLFIQPNFETYPQVVVTMARDFNSLLMKEIRAINDKRFETLFSSYEKLREMLETAGSKIEKMNRDFYDQLLEDRVEGVVFHEYSLLRLQNILDGATNFLTNKL
jgi:hypothetical protein